MNQVESEAKSQQKETDGSLIIWQSNGKGLPLVRRPIVSNQTQSGPLQSMDPWDDDAIN